MACPVSRVPGHPRILPHGKGPVPRRDSAVVTVCLAKIGFYPLRSLADVETVSSCPTPQAGSRTDCLAARMKQWLCSRGVWEMISRGSSSHDASGGCHWLFGTKRLTIPVRHILVSSVLWLSSCGTVAPCCLRGLSSGLGSAKYGPRNLDFVAVCVFWAILNAAPALQIIWCRCWTRGCRTIRLCEPHPTCSAPMTDTPNSPHPFPRCGTCRLPPIPFRLLHCI